GRPAVRCRRRPGVPCRDGRLVRHRCPGVALCDASCGRGRGPAGVATAGTYVEVALPDLRRARTCGIVRGDRATRRRRESRTAFLAREPGRGCLSRGGAGAEGGATGIMNTTQNDSPHGRVMIVDDSELNRRLLHRYLQREGYETVLAHDGVQALAMLRE